MRQALVGALLAVFMLAGCGGEEGGEVSAPPASDPKQIHFYDAGHELNDEARADRASWLAERFGLEG